jgi:hypothetical protein
MSRNSVAVERPAILRKDHFWNLITFFLALGWIFLVALTLSTDVDDFKQYWQAAVSMLYNGDPYVLTTGDRQGYYYPPPFAYLMQPLGRLNYPVAQRVWFGINVVLLAMLVRKSLRLSKTNLGKRYWGVVLLSMALAPPTRLTLQLGQISLLVAILLISTVGFTRRNEWIGGLSLAGATLIRLFPAYLALSLIHRRSWRVLIWLTLWCFIIIIISIAAYGVNPFVSYVYRSLLSGDYPTAAAHNISFLGFWQRLLTTTPFSVPVTNQPALALIATLVSSTLVVTMCLLQHRSPHTEIGEQIQYSTWLCGLLLISPTNGYYSLVLLLLPSLLVLRYLELNPDRGIRNWLVFATALIWIPPTWSDWNPALYQFVHVRWGVLFLTPSLYGLIIYFGLLVVLARRSNRLPPDKEAAAQALPPMLHGTL